MGIMVEEAVRSTGELKKTLSYPVLLLIIINSIIGSGMFFLPALGAQISGPSSIIAWIILSIVTLYVAACFAELAGMFPTAGGIYEFSKQAYGRFTSFIIGWVAWLVGNITTAMLIIAAVRYLLPGTEGVVSIGGFPVPVTFINIAFCIFWVLAFNFMAYRGMKTSSFMLVTFSLITVAVVLLLAIPALFKFHISNLTPFFIKPTFFGNFTAIVLTVFVIAQSFFGLESVLFLSGETKDPKKVLPKALIRGIIIIEVLTLLLVVAAMAAINWQVFSQSRAPFAELAVVLFGQSGRIIISIATYLVILGAAASWIVTGPRLVLALAEDRLFLTHFKYIHPKYNTPSKAILFQTAATLVFVILGSNSAGYETLLQLLVPIVILMLIAVLLCVVVLRKKQPKADRPFVAPFGKAGSIAAALFYLFLLVMWLVSEPGAFSLFKLALSFIFLGVPIYLLISIYYYPKMITGIRDVTAHISLLTERLTVPRFIRTEVFTLLGNMRGKTVLEYGCSVGTLTLQLAEAVGPGGRVFALDSSRNDLKITARRVDMKLWESTSLDMGKVHTLHDEELVSRIHPAVPYADMVVSVGMLAYIQDIKKVLKEINVIMPNGGKICFVEFVDFFRIIPNVEWLGKNQIIEKIFRDCGFSVQVLRKKGLFWNYAFVYGIKSRKDVAYI